MGNWSKRTTYKTGKNYRTTVTQNNLKGATLSSSQKAGNVRYTTSILPNGKIKQTKTFSQNGWTKRDTVALNKIPRVKKFKSKNVKFAKTNGDGSAGLGLAIIVLFFVIVGYFFK